MKLINWKVKLLAIFSFMLITFALFIAYSNPAIGYELSIYESTPFVVWIALILSIVGGVSLILHQVYVEQYKWNNFWLVGFLILILSRISLLYIPFIRGYYTWRGDNISHIGFLKDILMTHAVPSDNFYPAVHLFLAQVQIISGVSIEFIVNYSTALFSIIYVISIYLLSTTIVSSRKAQILSVAAIGGVLFNPYNVYLMPNGWSVNYLPLLFFIYMKFAGNNLAIPYKLLCIIILVLYPFFHPLSTIMIIAMFIIMWIIYLIHNWTTLKSNKSSVLNPINVILIEIAIFLPWIFSFPVFDNNIRRLFNAIMNDVSVNNIANMEITLNKINFDYFDFMEYIIKTMGDEIIFLVLTIIAAIILLKYYAEKRKNENLLTLIAFTSFFGLLYGAYLFNIIPGLENVAGIRLLRYLPIFTPIAAGFVFSYIIKKNHITLIICLVIIMTASTLTVLSLYDSPYITRPTPGITRMDIDGMKWILDVRNTDIATTSIMSPMYRFADGILGRNGHNINHYEPTIPDHFNYTTYKYLGESYVKDRYAVITLFDRIIYTTVWKVVGRFDKDDFEKLDEDLTVNKIYSNGETYVYRIYAN